MEFILSLYAHIPPSNKRYFYELDWHYKRYIQHKNEKDSQNSGSNESIDVRDMISNSMDINTNK